MSIRKTGITLWRGSSFSLRTVKREMTYFVQVLVFCEFAIFFIFTYTERNDKDVMTLRKTLGLSMGAIILLVMIGIYAFSFFNKGQSVGFADAVLHTIQLNVSSADIFVEQTSSDSIEVKTTETRTSKFDIREKSNGQLAIQQNTKGFLSWLSLKIHALSGDIKLKDIAVTSVQIEASSGDIKADDLKAETYDLRTTSGDMELGQLGSDAKEVSIRSSSGDILVKTLTTDTLLAESTSGDVSIDAITLGRGKSTVTTTSGDIHITPIFSEDTSLSIYSSSGDQILTNKNDNQFSFTIRTSSGDIRVPSSYTLTTEKDNEVAGTTATTSSNTLTMEASSGDVKIKD